MNRSNIRLGIRIPLRGYIRGCMERSAQWIRSWGKVRERGEILKRPLSIIKLIGPADLITLLNFICGVLAVMLLMNGGDGVRVAMFLILLGSAFDGLDGPVARKFGSSHNFGIWLDSIADAMTFCIAPSILIFNVFKETPGAEGSLTFVNIVVVITSLSIAILGILRLARFLRSTHKWKGFIGLPSPAFAMLVVSCVSLYFWSTRLNIDVEHFTTGTRLMVPALLLICSFAMISDVLYIKYRGRLLKIACFLLFAMMLSLLIGVHEPIIGMTGSIMFAAGCFGYLVSPVISASANWWALFRMMSYLIVGVNLLSFGVFLYVIAPYTSYFFFKDLRFWKYLKFYHKYYLYSFSYIYRIIRHERGLIKTVLPLTSPPMDRPDPALFRISSDWKLPADSCGDCNRCCTFVVKCCFLDESQNKCLSYGSLFWKFFNCGRFPPSKKMLVYCDCKKYQAV